MTEENPKDLLGKAFGQEPPLHLDREEIFRRGRRQVRVRRLAASGGVAAAVVAVIFGTAVVTNLGGEGNDVTPALPGSTRPPTTPTTEAAPPGPQLPLTTTTSAPADQRAVELTRVLAEARLIPAGYNVFSQSDGTTPLAFVRTSESYQAAANLQDTNGGGDVRVWLSRANPRVPATCANLTGKTMSCSEVVEQGQPMVLATQRSDDGVISNVVHAVRPDGTEILVSAGNAIRARSGLVIGGAKPALDFDVLLKIASLPRLTFG